MKMVGAGGENTYSTTTAAAAATSATSAITTTTTTPVTTASATGRRNSDLSRASASVRLDSNNHVIVVTKGHALGSPGVEEDASIDGTAGAAALANGPILLKGPDAVNGVGVGAGALAQSVGGPGVGDGSAALGVGAGVVLSVSLNDVAVISVSDELFPKFEGVYDWYVLFNKGVASPAIDGEVLFFELATMT